MKKITLLTVLTALPLLASPALAQDSSYGQEPLVTDESNEKRGLGVGFEATITGLNGAALVYDAGNFRIDAVLGISNQGNTDLNLAGRFWYVLHTGDMSDFAIGGGFGVEDADDGNGNNNNDADFHIEAGAQLRAFITSNVALQASGGFGIIIDEGDDFFGFGGQLMGIMGVTYFFK